MKRAEHPANTLTGPQWILGNGAKWLLSDVVRLSAAVVHLWLRALLLHGQKLPTDLHTVNCIKDDLLWGS